MSFEQGPIRPPSEASSLLLRVSRNCPWNRCAFCPVYKRRKFSRRSVEEVIEDIDEVADALEHIRQIAEESGERGDPSSRLLAGVLQSSHPGSATQAAAWWLLRGKGTVFLQDADPLSLKTEGMVEILERLRSRIPGVTRVTAYARSATLARRGAGKLGTLREAGLDRVHVGIESGSDEVLSLVSKGATHAQHVKGARAALDAGLELSAYVMPGLGGRALSRDHAIESARCIAAIEPSFTRLRTLAVTPRAPIADLVARGEIEPMGDDEVVEEIRLFLEGLEGVRTRLRSDHILNLLGDLEGDLPDDRVRLVDMIDAYLDLPDDRRLVYRLGRRAGLFEGPGELDDPRKSGRARALVEEVGGDAESIECACRELMTHWV